MESRRVSHYQIERLIARGGMGQVYEAVDLALDRRVALKFIAPELTADPESLKRFEREALAAAALNHPNIATLYALERDGDQPFLAMELLSGESLRTQLGGGPLAVDNARALVRDIADALAYAHRRGVIHRDIKPENLMFDEHRRIKITDFGLARLATTATVTLAGTVLGTAAYMAPESARGEAAAPADVFALGVVLHELLAGRPPFVGDGALAILYAIANQDAPALRSVRPEASEELEALVARMLSKAPDERPAAAEVAAALGGRRVAYPTGAITVPIDTRSSFPAPSSEGTGATTLGATAEASATSPDGTTGAPRPRGRGWLVFVGLAAASGLAFALIWPGLMARRAQEALGLNNRGVEALQRGDMDRARDLFQHALRLDPALGSAMINLGMVHSSQGRAPQAESLFAAALRRHPRDRTVAAQARYALGSIDLDSGAFESAAENLAASFGLDSSTARVHNNYALALVRVGRADEALALLRRGIARFPTAAPLHKNAGLALIELGRPAEALPYLDRALSLDSTLVEARRLRETAEAAASH
jgi:tetratricopeptide (TPR) repeat protein